MQNFEAEAITDRFNVGLCFLLAWKVVYKIKWDNKCNRTGSQVLVIALACKTVDNIGIHFLRKTQFDSKKLW
jgi:hypothetical protein